MRGALKADFRNRARSLVLCLLFVGVSSSVLPLVAEADDFDFLMPATYAPTFRAEHAGTSIYNGNPVNILLPPEVAAIRSSELGEVNGSWIIEELTAWGHDVPSERGVYVLERIDPATGSLEGGTAILGQNYAVAHVAFSGSSTTTHTVSFSMPNMGADGTLSGRYKLLAAELSEGKTDEDVGEFLEQGALFASVFAPSSFSISPAIFDYVNDGPPVVAAPVDGPPPCTENCFSNVLFLPGIKASRLYKPHPPSCITNCEDQLWEPNTNSDVEDLFLNSDGTSVRDDIYTRDIMDAHVSVGNGDVYGAFSTFMDSEVETGVIKDWAAVPYDWRLDLEHVVENGTSLDGHISYIGTATSSYAMNQVFRLASSSKSNKVTIVAHSNGGLFTKILMNKLKELGKENLVDKIIFVGVPQTGTPKAIGTLLHGYEEAILSGIITKASTARILASNLPQAYNLLPSEEYFHDVATPPILFPSDAATAQDLRTAYGDSIGTYQSLRRFLLGLEGRSKPAADKTNLPDILNYDLLARAEALHAELDSWEPPDEVQLYEVAGVGLGTPSGFRYVDECPIIHCVMGSPYLGFNPEMVIDGDGTVVDASALAGTGTKYYFNILQYVKNTRTSINHASIMGASDVNTLINRIVKEETATLLPSTVTTSKPYFADAKHLIYRVHSPVSLDLYDSLGNHTGVATTTLSDGTVVSYVENNVPGSYYDEFGEVKYIFSDGSEQVNIVLNGQGSGAATFDIDEMTGNTVVASTTFVNISVEPQTVISMSMSAGGTISGASNLDVDENGDGEVDTELPVGGTVMYKDFVREEVETLITAPTAPAPMIGGGNGPIVVAPVLVASTTSAATSTAPMPVEVATSTPVATSTVVQGEQSSTTSIQAARPVVAHKATPKKSATSTNSARLVAGAAASLPASSPAGEKWWSSAYKIARNIIRLIIGL